MSLVFLVLITGFISAVMILDARLRLARARPAIADVSWPANHTPIQREPAEWPPPADLRERPSPVAPSPPVETDPRRARPRIDVTTQQKADAARFERVLRRFYPAAGDRPDATMRVAMRVASDGRVMDARVLDSDFHHPEFEAAFIDEVKRTKYPDDERYRPTEFGFEFRSVKPLPQRPLAEIEALREPLLARIEKRRRAIFAEASMPEKAQLRVLYRVSPRGTVDEAKVESSTFRSTAFERAVIDEIRRQRFAAAPGYAPTRYAFEFAVGETPATATDSGG